MQKDNSSLLFLSGILVGAVVGGLTGILLAPASGEATRKEIAKKGKKTLDEIKKEALEIEKKLEPKITELKEEVGEKVDELKKGFTKGYKTAKK